MKPADWLKLKQLFDVLTELPPAERQAALHAMPAEDAGLKGEIERLLAHADEMGSFLNGESPAPSGISTFEAGEMVAERFRVVEFLGSGGMGEVYEAEDNAMAVRVALKTVRPDVASVPASFDRLRREIQLCRQVTHPNVSRVFDIGRHAGAEHDIVFFTMELLEGETLAVRIAARGALSPAQALAIARPVAEGLRAAHELGIVHGDLKPANIMLTESRAVVMDFGLAQRTVPASKSTTMSIPSMGTPSYMAPELLGGAPATVASDIYAFGATLHQALTGQKVGMPASDQPAMPAAWAAVVERCLKPAPQDRFASAAELVEALDAIPKGHRSRSRWVLAAASIVFLALVAWGMRLYGQKPTFPSGSVLLLADVTNATSDRELDAATEVFRSQLEQSPRVRLWDRSRSPAVFRAMNRQQEEKLRGGMAREVAMRDNVPFVLFANVAPAGDGIGLTLRLEQLAHRSAFARNSWTFKREAAGKSGLQDAIHEGAIWTRSLVGENAAALAGHDRLPQDTTTPSWEALAAYMHANEFASRRETGPAISLLHEALRYDPHFALAYMKLGDLLIASYRREEGLRYWQMAMDETNRQHLTAREGFRIRGLYYSDIEDYIGAEAAFSQAEVEYPEDYLPPFYLANVLRRQGRLEECVEKLRKANRMQTDSLAVISGLASAYLLSGLYAEMDAQIARLEKLQYRVYAAHYRGLERFAQGKYEEALAAFGEEANGVDRGRKARGVYYRAATLCELGRWSEARALLEPQVAAPADPSETDLRANMLFALAYLEWKSGHITAARQWCMDAISKSPSPALISRAGVLLARAGLVKEAQGLLERMRGGLEIQSTITARARLAGEVKLAAGAVADAVAEFERLDALDAALHLREGLARSLVKAKRAVAALPYYERAASAVAIWQTFERDYPGMATDALFDGARAAHSAGDDERARRWLSLYLERRRGADDSTDLSAAQALQKVLF